MLNKKWLRAIGISIPVATALLLFGMFGGVDTILFNTGIKLGTVFAIGNGVVAWLVYKNHI